MAWFRWLKLGALALATAFLAVSAWFWQQQWQARKAAQAQNAIGLQRLSQAKSLLPEIQRREALVGQVQTLSHRMAELGFEPGQWGQRRIQHPLGQLSRVEAARVLDALSARALPSVLMADGFELAVQTKEAGLFQVPRPGDEGVQLGLTATQFVLLQRNRP